MKTSIWYHTKEKQPTESGYYIGYRVWGFGGKIDGESELDYFYYDERQDRWLEHKTYSSRFVMVAYWTDAQPDIWVEKFKEKDFYKKNPALENAWKNVEEAYEKYVIVKNLSTPNKS